MADEVLNTLALLGHELLLVDVGGGFETHLCEATSDPTARPRSSLDRRCPPRWRPILLERGSDDERLAELLAPGLEADHVVRLSMARDGRRRGGRVSSFARD
jgi:hypothetical protein